MRSDLSDHAELDAVQLEAAAASAAGGRPKGPLGVVAEAVAPPQPATGRCKRVRQAEVAPLGSEKCLCARVADAAPVPVKQIGPTRRE